MGFLSNSKDRLIETVALPAVRSFLAPYGTARELHLNTTDKSAEIVIELKGEAVPVLLRIDRYDVDRRDGATFVTIHAVRTSREWLTALAAHNLIGRSFKVPDAYAGIVGRFA